MQPVRETSHSFEMDVEERLRSSARHIEDSRALISVTSRRISISVKAIGTSRSRLRPSIPPARSYSLLDGLALDLEEGDMWATGASLTPVSPAVEPDEETWGYH